MGKYIVDTSITFLSRILQLILGIGALVIIARVLGPQSKGIYSLAILFPSLLISFGNFGFAQASVFYTGRKKYPPEEILTANIFLSFFIGTIGFLIGLMIVIFFGNSLFPEIEIKYLILALFLIPLGLSFSFLNYILLGLQKIKQFNFINILRMFVFLILTLIILLALKFGINATIVANIISWFIVANIMSWFIGTIALFYLVTKIIGFFGWYFNKHYVKDAFTFGFKIYLGNIIGLLRYKTSIFLVNIFLNPIATGFYSVATEIAERIWLISRSAGLILFSKISSETDEKKLKELTPIICRNILLITLIGAIFLFIGGRLLITFFYSDIFLESISPFRILLIGAVAMSGTKVLSNDLYGRKKAELNIYINFVTVILNIVLNILWIPKYGIIGSAWATSVSYIASFVIITIVYGKISGNRIFDIIFPKKFDFFLYKNLIYNTFLRS